MCPLQAGELFRHRRLDQAASTGRTKTMDYEQQAFPSAVSTRDFGFQLSHRFSDGLA